MHRVSSSFRSSTHGLIVCAFLVLAGPGLWAQPAAKGVEPWTTQDIIDSRIDTSAQYSLMRLCKGAAEERMATSSILQAVKSGALEGIYIQDQQVPALRAKNDLGKGWWDLLPQGVDALCVTVPANRPPVIALRKGIAQDPHRVDAAIVNAWQGCGLASSEIRPCIQTLPPKQPRVERKCQGDATGRPKLTVGVQDFATGPLGGATVVVEGTGVWGSSHSIAQTSAAGAASFDLEGPGGYVIQVARPGAVMLQRRNLTIEGSCHHHVAIGYWDGTSSSPPSDCDRDRYHASLAACWQEASDLMEACYHAYRSDIHRLCPQAETCVALLRQQEDVSGCVYSLAEVCGFQAIDTAWRMVERISLCISPLLGSQRQGRCESKARAESNCIN